ncbi:NAD(P)/FAD-dependent oxidoreductase [Burkholderia cepacia]|uniref:NAD(P)/FAD-dependent oxidoreductase n=1 Tax=Burkholderia cepacia TaxID=292 RepID=UPI002AB7EEA8|nr:FAD-binding oxidoreductase [Burkholderia cepacia]
MDRDTALPRSLWAATAAPAPSYFTAKGDLSAQIVVVGGGYVGLSAALHLARGGKSVIVLDGVEPGWGASGRNGGQAIASLKILPDELVQIFGRDKGEHLAQTMASSTALVYELIEQYKIDCQLERKGWIQAAHGEAALALLRDRHRQWTQRGVAARLLGRDEAANMIGCAPDIYTGAWFDPRGGLLQPLSWARGLARAVIQEGGLIAARARVTNVCAEGSRWIVRTSDATVRCDQVLLATNAYTDQLWPGLKQTVVPVTSFQVATAPLPESILRTVMPGRQGVTDTRRLLHYFRLDHTRRLVMGGRSPVDDEPDFTDATSLQRAIARTFPQCADIPLDYVWSGRVALTKDSLPHIHILANGLYAALGCNGRGVANATMMGKLLAALADGVPAAELALPVTALDPFLFYRFRKLGVLAAATWYRILDQIESRGASDIHA